MLFTLEASETAAEVTIHWPSGRVDKLTLAGDRYWRVMEGQPATTLAPQRPVTKETL